MRKLKLPVGTVKASEIWCAHHEASVTFAPDPEALTPLTIGEATCDRLSDEIDREAEKLGSTISGAEMSERAAKMTARCMRSWMYLITIGGTEP